MLVKSIRPVTPRTVYAVKTTTRTFIADGLAHHNCSGCNLFGRGRYADYFHVMVERYGLERVNQMIEQARQTKKYSAKDYEEIALRYQSYATDLTAFAATSPTHQETIAYISSELYKQDKDPLNSLEDEKTLSIGKKR